MKYSYIAATVKKEEKYYSFVIKVSESDNILSKLKFEGIQHANIYPTKKRAEQVVQNWNACHKANCTYLFDSPTF